MNKEDIQPDEQDGATTTEIELIRLLDEFGTTLDDLGGMTQEDFSQLTARNEPDIADLLRRLRRRSKNKHAARRSRQRKAETIEALSEDIEACNARSKSRSKILIALQDSLERYRKSIEILKELRSSSGSSSEAKQPKRKRQRTAKPRYPI